MRWQSDAVSHFFKWPAIKGKINWKSYWRVLLSRQNQCSQRFWFISIDVFKLLQRSSCHVWPITRFCGFNLCVFSKWNINFQFRSFWDHHFYYTLFCWLLQSFKNESRHIYSFIVLKFRNSQKKEILSGGDEMIPRSSSHRHRFGVGRHESS